MRIYFHSQLQTKPSNCSQHYAILLEYKKIQQDFLKTYSGPLMPLSPPRICPVAAQAYGQK